MSPRSFLFPGCRLSLESMVKSPVPVASRATAEALELPSLLALYAQFGATDVGRGELLSRQPSTSLAEVEQLQCRVRDTRKILEDGALVPSQEEPLLPLLTGLAGGELSIDGIQLVHLATVLRITQQAAERVRSSEIETPDLDILLAELPDTEPLRRRIVKSLDKRGRVRDDASPQLVRLRRQAHRVRDSLYKLLQKTLVEDGEHFSEDTVSLKDGRLTLLLEVKARGQVGGLVHGRSGSGRNLHFEPLSAVEGNNRLQETIEEEEIERRRILTELISQAQDELPAIEAHFEVLGQLDLLQAVCRFAEQTESLLPEMGRSRDLRLLGARHPLLDPRLAPLRERALGQAGHLQPAVPLDLELDADQRILVITGPNAGGKTVALKTVGLLALAAQCGLPIPVAAGTRLPMFQTVMAMVGDEQDLLADQSTFSARLQRLKEAWEVAAEASLVLLDELGSGTDPEEGSALAVALLEGLLERETLAVLTTHLTQVAAVALQSPGAGCAAMEFDPETGGPTYHLRPGAPGGSQALALARRLELPTGWLDRAEALLGEEHRDLRRLLAEVESVRQQLATTQSRLETESRDLEKQRQRLTDEVSAAKEERQRMGERMRTEVEEFRQQVTKRFRKEMERLREEVVQGRKKGLVSAGVGRLFEEAPEIELEEAGDEPPVVGGLVRHRSLGWNGRLEKVKGGAAEVAVHGKRIRCALADLASVRENAGVESRRPSKVVLRSSAPEDVDVPVEMNLVGYRVEPALEELDRYLDRALLSSHAQVRVIHGFGTGRLRQAIREYLPTHPAVDGIRSGRKNEGGDGATVVTLSKS